MAEYYYNGNNALREAAQPAEAPVRRRSPQELQEIRRRKNLRKAVRRNREREMQMSKGYVAFLCTCVIIMAVSLFNMIQLQSSITASMNRVSKLESQVAELQTNNDARYREVTSSVDLTHVKDVAVNELGMTYVTEDQVEYYTVEKSNYMDQYSDIPQ